MLLNLKNRKDQATFIKGLRICSQAMIFVQMALVVLVLLVSLHLFLRLVGQPGLTFLSDFFIHIKYFIVSLFGSNIKSSQPEVDGELVLFVLFCIFMVYVCYQLKEVNKKVAEILENKFEAERIKYEEIFNANLQRELLNDTMKLSCAVLAVQLKIKSILNDPVKSTMVTAEKMMEIKQRVLTDFFTSIKDIKNVSFSKDNDILVIYTTNFNEIDNILFTVESKLDELSQKYRLEKILIKAKLAINAGTQSDTPKAMYKEILPLLGLNYPGTVLCFGNVKGRYTVSNGGKYIININGKYEINGKVETVWAFVKKY